MKEEWLRDQRAQRGSYLRHVPGDAKLVSLPGLTNLVKNKSLLLLGKGSKTFFFF